MGNIVHFSGCHGSGKSTLIQELISRHPDFFLVNKKRAVPKNEDVYERTKIRLVRHYLHGLDAKVLSDEHPDKVVLSDRCVHDAEAYMRAFLDIGWVSREQMNEYEILQNALFSNGLATEHVIFVDATYNEAVENLQRRARETGITKWREDNLDYLRAVQESYRRMYNGRAVLVVNTMDLSKRVEMCIGWMSHRFRQFDRRMTDL